jgi:hypothetical protein
MFLMIECAQDCWEHRTYWGVKVKRGEDTERGNVTCQENLRKFGYFITLAKSQLWRVPWTPEATSYFLSTSNRG